MFIAFAPNVCAHFMRCDWRLACSKSRREEGQERPVHVMLQALRTGNRDADELEGCHAVRHEGDLLCLWHCQKGVKDCSQFGTEICVDLAITSL